MINSHKKFIKDNYKTMSINDFYNYFDKRYTKKQIRNFCNRNGLKYRKLNKDELKAALSVPNKKQRQQIQINHNYFKTWSKNMAYIFGLWCADGHIYENKGYYFSIKLHKQDKYLLQKILDEMNSKHNIYENKDNSCHITFSSKTIYHDIIRLGGKERKSLDMNFPYVPNEYLADFIRGYFDGDGSIHKDNGDITICGTKEFLNELNNVLKNQSINITNIHQYNIARGNNTYKLQICRKNEIINFINFIYNDVDNLCLYMKRKRDICYAYASVR